MTMRQGAYCFRVTFTFVSGNPCTILFPIVSPDQWLPVVDGYYSFFEDRFMILETDSGAEPVWHDTMLYGTYHLD